MMRLSPQFEEHNLEDELSGIDTFETFAAKNRRRLEERAHVGKEAKPPSSKVGA